MGVSIKGNTGGGTTSGGFVISASFIIPGSVVAPMGEGEVTVGLWRGSFGKICGLCPGGVMKSTWVSSKSSIFASCLWVGGGVKLGIFGLFAMGGGFG